MPYNDQLANQIRSKIDHLDGVTEKVKMSGLTFMRHGKLLVRIEGNDLLIRCEKEATEELLQKKGARRYVMKNRTNMKGWIVVDQEGQRDFGFWMSIAIDFNESTN